MLTGSVIKDFNVFEADRFHVGMGGVTRSTDAVLTQEPLHALLAGSKASSPQFPHHARTAGSPLEFNMNGRV